MRVVEVDEQLTWTNAPTLNSCSLRKAEEVPSEGGEPAKLRDGGLRQPPRARHPFRFETIHTVRYLCLHRAGVIVCPDSYAMLDAGCAPTVVDRVERFLRLLAA